MARSIVHKRSLDIKMIANPESSNHEIQFNTLVEIKKEREDDLSDMEIELSSGATATESTGPYDVDDREFRSTNISRQHDASRDVPQPRILLNFGDLRRRSRQSADFPKKRTRSDGKGLENEMRQLKDNKRRRSEFDIPSGIRDTRPRKGAADKEEKEDLQDLSRLSSLETSMSCESCGKCFTSEKYLQAHKRYYTADGEFHCTICDSRFSRSLQLSRHMKMVHSPLGGNNRRKYKCHLCSAHFKTETSLTAHLTHMHYKPFVSQKVKKNSNQERASLRGLHSTEKEKEKTTFRRSQRVRKHVVSVNDNNGQTISDDNSKSTQDSNELVGNRCEKNEHLTHENLRMQHNDECSNNELTDDHLDSNSSTQQQVKSSFNDPNEKFVKPKNLQEVIDQGDVEPQPDETDDISGCSNASTAVNCADQYIKIEIDDIPQHTIYSPSKMTILNSPTMNMINTADNSDQESLHNEEFSLQEEGTNATEDDFTESKFLLQLDGVDNKQNLSPLLQQFDQQVGSTLLQQDYKATRRNIKTDDAAVERAGFGINSIQVDDFGATYESTLIKCEDEEMSDGSCASLFLKMTASSNVSSADSLSLDSRNAIMPAKHDIRDDQNIKDVRVMLVKLDNMVNESTDNSPPKSSPLENHSLVETEKPYCNLCGKQFSRKVSLWRHSKSKHNSAEPQPNRELRSTTRKTRVTANHCPKLLSNKNKLKRHRNLRSKINATTVRNCYLCVEVFEGIFPLVAHYMSVHIEVGVLECCLCPSKFKTIARLKKHLHKHYRGYTKNSLKEVCIVCKKKLTFPNLIGHCFDCSRSLRAKKRNSRKEQFLNALKVTEHRSASTQASKKVHVSTNESVSLRSNSRAGDRDCAKHYKKVVPRKTCKDILKHYKCSICNRVFLGNSRLKHHLLTAHSTNSQTLSHSTFRNCNNKLRKRCANENNLPKLRVGRKKHFKSKNIDTHDKSCKQMSFARRRLRFSRTNGNYQHLVRQHHITANKKICYDHKCNVCGLKCCCSRGLEIHKTRYSTNGNNRCDLCGLTFARKHLLAVHTKTAHDKKISFNGRFRCVICNQGFYNEKLLRIHLAHFHDMKNFQCNICRIRFDTCRQFKAHVEMYSKNESYLCGICDQSFECKYMLKYHNAEVHNREKLQAYKYLCDICNCAFVNQLLLKAHIGHVHFYKMLDCEVETNTDTSFSETTELLPENVELSVENESTHISSDVTSEDWTTYTEPLVETESTCTSSDVTAKDLTIKKRSNEEQSTQEITEDVVDRTIRKNTCIRSDVTTNDLTIQEHSNEQQSTQGITEGAINKTIRTNASSVYKCGLCKLNFTDPLALLNHEWKYSNDGAYICHICYRKFTSINHLKNHKIKHYQRNVIRKYECYVCKEDFSKIDELKMHGVHLHGPQFVCETGFETSDRHTMNMLSRINRDFDDVLASQSSVNGDNLLMESVPGNKIFQSGKILLFHKIAKGKAPSRLLRWNLSEETYRCCFCETNFSCASVLKEHFKEHAYRAYYTNSSRYLCLICKEKFRTNDVLRAHVIHSHTSNDDEQPQKIGKSGCSKDIAPDTSMKSQTYNNKRLYSILKCNNQVKNTDKRTIDKDSESIDLGGNGNTNSSRLRMKKYRRYRSRSRTTFYSWPEEVRLFTVGLYDMNGSEWHACNICTTPFNSVEGFRNHFASVHVRNGAYFCSSCGKMFSVMSDLKYHMRRHEGEPNYCLSCNREFLQIRDFVRHRLLHDEQSKKLNKTNNTQSPTLLTLFEVESLEDSNDDSDSNPTVNPCKCEICDKVCPDFDAMLKHWDSCIDRNGIQCDLCRATFKSLDSFRMHQTTHHGEKRNFRILQNRRSLRLNGDQTTQVSVQSSTVHNKELAGEITIGNSLNINATENLERELTLPDKLSNQNESKILRRRAVKPFAKILPNLKNRNERHVKKHQEKRANEGIQPRPELKLKRGKRSSKRPDVSETAQKSISIVNSIPSEMIDDTTISIPFSNNISKHHFLPNKSVSSHRFQQNEHNEERLAISQLNFSGTANNSSSGQSAAQTSINIDNTWFSLAESVQISHLNNSEDAMPLNLLPASMNAVDNPGYYLCIENAIGGPYNVNNSIVAPSGPGKNSLTNDDNAEMLSNPVHSVSGNPNVTQTYFLCIKPIPDNSSKRIIQTVPVNNPKSKPSPPPCDRTVSKLQMLLEKSPVVVLNPVRSSDIQTLANHSNSNSKQDVVSNDSTSKSDPSSDEGMGVTALPATATQTLANKFNSNSNRNLVSDDLILESDSNSNEGIEVPILPVTAIKTLADKSDGDNQQNLVSNDSTTGLHSNPNKGLVVPILLPTASTSTSSEPSVSHENASTSSNISTDGSSSDKESAVIKQVVRCTFCNLLFEENAKLIKHMEIHKTDNQCPACGLVFSTESGLEKHLHEHKSSTCVRCSMTFFISDSITHRRGTRKYCSVCDTLLPTPTRKLGQLRKNSKRHVIKCGICMETFCTMAEMSVHFKQIHSTFACGTCDSRFTTKKHFHSHMQTHGCRTPEKFYCKTCKKFFISELDLTNHKLFH